ncbi:MAG: aminoglycoside 3-N-acetyltransferase [Chloroflexota bacterium]|jgi:aminoglycoside N3'-acetyltransferase|nr:aminoglycoside 3-N-acetyltransferase [Chloroflexota bacterium]
MAAPRTVAELAADLRRLGVREGDLLMVHASLRRIGPVEGRAEGVVRAIERAVGPDGTMMMILGSDDPFDWVNKHPEAERAALLADAEPFDYLATPVLPEVGTLAEVVRTLPGTVVNDHPDARFAARGRRAAELLAGVPWDDYYGGGSPLDRLVRWGGRILRLGANPDTVTALHHAEWLAEVPNKMRVVRHRRVRRGEGAEIVRIDTLDDEEGIVDYPGEDYFAVILKAYLGDGRGATGRVGEAESELIDAADIVAFGKTWMEEHFIPGGGAGQV